MKLHREQKAKLIIEAQDNDERIEELLIELNTLIVKNISIKKALITDKV